MTSTTRDITSLTVAELKDVLKNHGLGIGGSKAELIERVKTANPKGEWLSALNDNVEDSAAISQREAEVIRREKELVERELELARREIEMLRSAQLTYSPAAETVQEGYIQPTSPNRSAPFAEPTKVNVAIVADLLSYFDGSSEHFETWEKQIIFLQTAYHLGNDMMKILIGMKLKGKAFEWFHSKPQYLQMTSEALLSALRNMFFRRPNRIMQRRKFEERTWRKSETFQDYVHEKVILANRISISDEDIAEYIIEGIPDPHLQDLARVQRFTSRESLLAAFGEITLQGRNYPSAAAGAKVGETSGSKRRGDRGENNAKDESRGRGKAGVKSESGDGSRRVASMRCYNCGNRNHVSAVCPDKGKGPKCFNCSEHGHVATNCPEKQIAKNTCVVSRSRQNKHSKEVKINGTSVLATIDTGSDLTLMRADECIKLGLPKLRSSSIPFRGVGTEINTTLGEFDATITTDGHSYPIVIRVISDDLSRHKLLIGRDFLDTVNLNMNGGKTTISPMCDETVENDLPEICQIDVCDSREEGIDLLSINDVKHRGIIQNFVEDYNPVKTREVGVKMSIILRDDEPVYQRARRLCTAERDSVNAQISEWMNNGIVRPSVSDYASPIVVVKKKDGSNRVCIDYRLLNKKVIKDRYPLPLIQDQLDKLQDAKVFSTLDLKNGFFHVEVEESSRKYTAFIIPDGHFEFLRVPFGLCNSPAIFQKFINAVFRDLIRDGVVLTYMDDLIVPSADYESGLKNLKRVLDTASETGLIINWDKCRFLQSRVEFLGHVIEDGRVEPSQRKTEAVKKFPKPTNIRQVQGFLGLTGYFRKFVPGYSLIARPLTNLLKADAKFQFGREQNDAFIRLKIALINRPVLSLYRQNAETELHTDASKHGYGAILLQRSLSDNALHPVYYASGKTTGPEEKYTSYELEVLAVVKALTKFRVYLLGITFKIVTDCRAFALTMSKKDLCVRVARWALQLEEFDYSIEHRPGKNMMHVDALSRNPLPTCLLVDETEDGFTARLKKAQQEDAELKRIVQLVEQGQAHGFIVRGGLLFKEIDGNILLVVPKAMCSQVVRQAHERGHFSVNKTEAIVKRDYWIRNLRQKVEKIVRNCVNCILAEKKQGRQEGFLHPIDKGEIPLDTFHIDHLGPLASTRKKYRHILVVVDSFSKFTWLYATKSTSSAEVVDKLSKQAAIFGSPRKIISDRGTAFTASEFENYCKLEKIQHTLTTVGVPRANGQVERVNRTIIPLLTKLSFPKHDEWYKYLNEAQRYLNTTPHRSINSTPFEILFGVRARLREDPQIRELIENDWTALFQDNRNELRLRASESIARIQEENRRGYNKRRKAATLYREGDMVAIKRTQRGPGLKLAAKYLGPYSISRVLRNNRYLVRKVGEQEGPLQTSTAVDFMKPWLGDVDSDDEDPEDRDEDDEDECDDDGSETSRDIRGRMSRSGRPSVGA